MDRHGNTSAASIPVALNERAENGQLQMCIRDRVQQLAAPVAGGISADQNTLCFQIFCPPRNGSLICGLLYTSRCV